MTTDAVLRERLVTFVHSFAGGDGGEVKTLVGDASTRRYHRVRTAGVPAGVVVMELPREAPTTTGTGGGTSPELPFLNVQRYLQRGGYPVPTVYRADLEAGLIALEDLGDTTLERAVTGKSPAERRPYYTRAVELCVELQRLGRANPDPGCLAFGRRFDQPLLRWELDHFREWLLENDRGVRLTDGESEILDRFFGWVAQTLADQPQHLVHRDFQSRNLMVVSESAGTPALKVIDFQDALMGSQVYDMVALLRDSYVELADGEVDDLLGLFADRAGIADQRALRGLFDLQALQRKLKDAGRFIFIDRVRKNPSFLRWVPTSLRYVKAALGRVPQAEAAREVLERHVPELR